MPFWPFVRRIRVEQLTPEQLREQLVAAAYSGRGYLRRFCLAYRQQIEAQVASLIKGPPGLENEPAKMNRMVQGLGTAAQCLANECGSPALWQALTGDEQSNPLVRWQKFLDALPDRMQRLEHDALRKELSEFIEEIKRFGGEAARQHEAFFNGRLGEVCFHSGQVDEARPFMERALEICRATKDQQGVAVYLGNLAEIARYRGDAGGAMALLEEQRAQWLQLGRHNDVTVAAGQLKRLRAGEPLCRVVCRDGDRTCELDELRPAIGKHYHFEYVRNRPQLQKAITLTRQGSEKAAAGELAAAIELFQAASEVDPHDPDPHYQCGVALMDLGAYDQAREAFAEVERLAPGWFRCRADQWLAGQIASGELPAETWMVLHGLEDGGLPKPEIERLARQALDRFPQFTPLWLVLGDCLRDRNATSEAQVAYRTGLDCAREPDVESRLLCALAGILPAGAPERAALVERALGLRGSLLAQAMACFLRQF